jgi:hypothetical protein
MAVINANLRLTTATIKVGADDYTAHIQDFQYVPSAVTSEVTDVSGKVTKFAGAAGWDLNLNVFQDFTSTGLARKMLTDEGNTAVMVIVDGPTTYTSTVTLVAPAIGGATKQQNVSSVTLPSTKPVLTASA